MISYAQSPTLTVKTASADTIGCIIENPTAYNLYMGQEYRLFALENDEWREIDLSGVPMTLELFGVEPGGSIDFTAHLNFELSAGTYMITKPVSIGGEEEAVLAGSFTL